jgi:hypothetical protein
MRIVVEGTHRNPHEPTSFIEKWQGGTALTAEHMGEALRISRLEGPKMLSPARVSERIDLEEEVGSEGCPGCLAASRAVAIVRPNRAPRQFILNRSAEATS